MFLNFGGLIRWGRIVCIHYISSSGWEITPISCDVHPLKHPVTRGSLTACYCSGRTQTAQTCGGTLLRSAEGHGQMHGHANILFVVQYPRISVGDFFDFASFPKTFELCTTSGRKGTMEWCWKAHQRTVSVDSRIFHPWNTARLIPQEAEFELQLVAHWSHWFPVAEGSPMSIPCPSHVHPMSIHSHFFSTSAAQSGAAGVGLETTRSRPIPKIYGYGPRPKGSMVKCGRIKLAGKLKADSCPKKRILQVLNTRRWPASVYQYHSIPFNTNSIIGRHWHHWHQGTLETCPDCIHTEVRLSHHGRLSCSRSQGHLVHRLAVKFDYRDVVGRVTESLQK